MFAFDSVVAASIDHASACHAPTDLYNISEVTADTKIPSRSRSHVERSLQSKYNGVLQLHNVSCSSSIRSSVYFTVAATSFGSFGQSNHAAAKCSLDALAQARMRASRAASSIFWGIWGNNGDVTDQARNHAFYEIGDLPLGNTLGMASRLHVTNTHATSASVLPMPWSVLLRRGFAVPTLWSCCCNHPKEISVIEPPRHAEAVIR